MQQKINCTNFQIFHYVLILGHLLNNSNQLHNTQINNSNTYILQFVKYLQYLILSCIGISDKIHALTEGFALKEKILLLYRFVRCTVTIEILPNVKK